VRLMFLSRNGEMRSIDTDSKLCVFSVGGKTKTAKLRCAATYVARLIESGWKVESIETEESAGA
jgi:hypothetical protein